MIFADDSGKPVVKTVEAALTSGQNVAKRILNNQVF